jgi:hypothetical protein
MTIILAETGLDIHIYIDPRECWKTILYNIPTTNIMLCNITLYNGGLQDIDPFDWMGRLAGKKTACHSAPLYTQNDHFAKTGSGQTYRKLKKRAAFSHSYSEYLRRRGGDHPGREHADGSKFRLWDLWKPGAKSATFCAIYTLKRSFYQDRLGTNMAKTQRKSAGGQG